MTYEHELEDWAAARFAEAGHLLLKFLSPGFPGVPDRILLTATGVSVFIEFKRPGDGRLRKSQRSVIATMRDMKHRVEIVDTRAQVELLLRAFA